ncbi:porin [Bradyrhizobium sp. Pear77]|uniref:porin n=1 Tax=Bradyrhizobium altum TaxID=1571202 RepID=UPI001E3247EF|nr:porin [Bradyrhizobium altum]MCC8957360.1 porin [Bradyrhizobium altum]
MRPKPRTRKGLKDVARVGVLSAVASGAFALSANAADLDTLFTKAPPVIPDLTWKGITVIGAIDLSGQYETHSTPYAGQINGTSSLVVPTNQGPGWFLAPNQTIQSYIGVKVDQPITDDLRVIGRLEIGFNPTGGELVNGPRSLQMQNGIPLTQQTMSADSARAGQIFNGDAYGGFALKQWGELRAGRNTAVSTDMLYAYDPLLSLGFSLFGYSGIIAGQGSIEPSKLDSSVKYVNQVGMFRTELLYGAPGTDVRQFYQGAIGIVRPEFSVDAFAGQAKDIVNLSSLNGAANVGSPFLGARVSDTVLYGIFGKYVFDVGGRGYSDPDSSKFIVSGGWSHVDFTNPSDGGLLPGHSTIGGFQIGPVLATNGAAGSGIVNYAYTGGDRQVDAYFISGKYQYDHQWSVAAAYYVFSQGSYGLGVNKIPGVAAPIFSNAACSSSGFINCSGLQQAVGLRVDYDWTKNLKLYAGAVYSKVSGGFAFGYIHQDEFAPTVGMRLTF